MTAIAIEEAAPAWPSTIREEFEANQLNGRVGTRLLSETDRARLGNSTRSW
jgi:beta-alanine degradation protein BauB